MSKNNRPSRQPTRPGPEPRSLPASNGNAAVAVRDQGPALVRSPEETSVLRMLSNPATKKAMASRLGKLFTPDTMIAMVSTCLRQSPLLAKCDPMTIVGAVLEVAQVGLRLDRTLGQAYLVPFYSSKRQCYEATLILGYRGLITMAEHAGAVQAVRAKVVHAKDHFVYEEGLVPKLEHRPFDGDDAGAPTHVYAVIHKAGLAVPYVMRWSQIAKLKSTMLAKAGGGSPWATHEEEMACKTAIRRGLKYHPLAPAQQRLLNLDEFAEEGVDQELGLVGEAAMEAIAESSEDVAAAKDAARNEAATPGVVAQPEREQAGAHAQAPAQQQLSTDEAPALSPDEEAAFERDVASRKGEGDR